MHGSRWCGTRCDSSTSWARAARSPPPARSAWTDVRALIEQWQLDLSGPALTSMWQVGAIVGPWNALVSGRWLELTSARVRPGPGLVPAVLEQEDPYGFVRFARALLTLLILDALQQGPQEGGLVGGPDTFAALDAHPGTGRSPAPGDGA